MPEAVFTYVWTPDLQVRLESVKVVDLPAERPPAQADGGVNVHLVAAEDTVLRGVPEEARGRVRGIFVTSGIPTTVPSVTVDRRSERAWTAIGTEPDGKDVVSFLQAIGRLPEGDYFLQEAT